MALVISQAMEGSNLIVRAVIAVAFKPVNLDSDIPEVTLLSVAAEAFLRLRTTVLIVDTVAMPNN